MRLRVIIAVVLIVGAMLALVTVVDMQAPSLPPVGVERSPDPKPV